VNQAQFILARDKRNVTTDAAQQEVLRQECVRLIDDEINLARRMYQLAIADSRLGYEASNHYYYVPLDLVEKVVNCVQLREQFTAAP
jgi:hypothetical protein